MGLNNTAFALMIAAAVLFAVAFFVPQPWATKLFSLGAAILTVALIFQFGAKTHPTTF